MEAWKKKLPDFGFIYIYRYKIIPLNVRIFARLGRGDISKILEHYNGQIYCILYSVIIWIYNSLKSADHGGRSLITPEGRGVNG
jgi:hypothetical protein